ncbi:MAG: hypothetical protein KF893_09825 [Caldilineaceae bacterium]|nr:hypothetical protein [Caldilineaceae bacterium]
MTTLVGKTSFAQAENPVPAFGLGEALDAAIADGDFRTYVLLCQWAWQEHPGAEKPFTEHTYEQMAKLHPAHRRPTAETVRGRIYRLTQAGLVRRERAGQTLWRTYPVLETNGRLLLGGMQRYTQSHVPAPAQDVNTILMDTQAKQPPDRAGAPHPGRAAGKSAPLQSAGRVEGTHPDPVTVRQGHIEAPDRSHEAHPPSGDGQPAYRQASERASALHPDGLGGHEVHTQSATTRPVGGGQEHTQPKGGEQARTHTVTPAPLAGQPVHTQTPGCVERVHPDPMAGQPQPTQDHPQQPMSEAQAHTQKSTAQSAPTSGGKSPTGDAPATGRGASAHPDGGSSRARGRASVLTGTDPLSFLSSYTGREDQSISTEGTDVKPLSHKVLSLVTVPAGYDTLAVTLATMQPQG